MVQQYKAIFIIITAVIALFVASPLLQKVLVYPQTDFFTELWLLGPQHSAENYPYNVTVFESYNVFLGIANNLGQCSYYVIEVKFRNQTQSAPNSFKRSCSSLPSLYSTNAFLMDKTSWELPITFSFDYSYNQNASTIDFSTLQLNNVTLNLNGYSTSWDSAKTGFFGVLFFEVWLYNSASGSFQYHERYVDLKLNFQV